MVKEDVIKNEDEKKEIKVGLSTTIIFSLLFIATIIYMIIHALIK